MELCTVRTSRKGRAIKGLVVCNNWDLEPFDLINGLALGCYQPYPEVLIVLCFLVIILFLFQFIKYKIHGYCPKKYKNNVKTNENVIYYIFSYYVLTCNVMIQVFVLKKCIHLNFCKIITSFCDYIK